MRALNLKINELDTFLEGKKIVPFGMGAWLKALEIPEMERHFSQIAYVIDSNAKNATANINYRGYKVFKPDVLKKEKEDVVVILCSPIYQLEMFEQLEDIDLDDNISVISLPFLAIQQPSLDESDLKRFLNKPEKRIPKVIHSFWFSKDKRPYNYQKCVDSWYENCSDYKIIEWNLDNYDIDNAFFKRAIELKAWAYATDYARLDIINQFGGWYLDMDVKVFKPFDDLLSNKAVFSFSNRCFIDTAVFAAEKNNPVVKKILHLYERVELPTEREGFKKFFPAAFEREVFRKEGVVFNGSLQETADMTVVPSQFFMPLDVVLFKDFEVTEYTYAVHYDNFGWGDGGKDIRSKKKDNNNKLLRLFEKMNG